MSSGLRLHLPSSVWIFDCGGKICMLTQSARSSGTVGDLDLSAIVGPSLLLVEVTFVDYLHLPLGLIGKEQYCEYTAQMPNY